MNLGDNSESQYINAINFNDLVRVIYLMLNCKLSSLHRSSIPSERSEKMIKWISCTR